MPDNLRRRTPEDPRLVNINQAWELAYWSSTWGVSQTAIISAVKAVGPLVKNVKRMLKIKS